MQRGAQNNESGKVLTCETDVGKVVREQRVEDAAAKKVEAERLARCNPKH